MSEADKLAENSVYIDTINSLCDLQIMFAKSLWEDYHGRLFLSPLKFKSALIVIKSYILYQFMSNGAAFQFYNYSDTNMTSFEPCV